MTGILFPDALILALARRPFLGIFAVLVSLALFLLSPLFAYQMWKRNHGHTITFLTKQQEGINIKDTSA